MTPGLAAIACRTRADIVAWVQVPTAKLWAWQDRHVGDRHRLFSAVADAVDVSNVLYPGSFVDVAASFVFESVTYVDSDRRAARFFADRAGVGEIIRSHRVDGADPGFEFIAGDYRKLPGLDDQSFDLLVSLYAGFVSEHCARYLRIGGWLLVNPSHGDAAMASIDRRFRLVGVVRSRGADGYRIATSDLDTYLIPKRPQEVSIELIHTLGRGIGYTRSPFGYLFQRIE